VKCVIEGNGVKCLFLTAFGKAIHALARIGDKLCLDPMVKVCSAHSAYDCFLFTTLFFQHYSPDTGPAQDCGTVKYKLVMKVMRNVDRCQISINLPDNRVIFQFH
uniref:Uncharacterized protein n=1 Tax=Oncorhynchus kisutch TaxID=8019 RepID=A0A8C7KDJ7_ONCKI